MKIAHGWVVGASILALSAACTRTPHEQARKNEDTMSGVVRIDGDDGSAIRREFTADNRAEIMSRLKNEITAATSGKFQTILRVSAPDPPRIQTAAVKMVGRIEHGQLQGLVRNLISVEGKEILIGEFPYRNDLQDGIATIYFPTNGQVAMRCQLRENFRDGELNAWYANGQMALKCRYARGQLDGACAAFDPQGGVLAEGTYEQGKRISGTFVDDPGKVAKMAHLGIPYEIGVTDAAGTRLRTPTIVPPRHPLPDILRALENM